MSPALLRSETLSRLRLACVPGHAFFSRYMVVTLVVICLLGFPHPTVSTPLEILIQHSNHRLEFDFERQVPPSDNPGTNIHLAHQSAAPVSVAINTNPFTGTTALYAYASSEVFGVSAFTPAPYPNDPLMASVRVSATSELEFTPVVSDSGMLSILFTASGHWFDCSSGSLTLVDLTTDTEIHNLGWFYESDKFLGGPPPPYSNELSVSVPLINFFDFGHTYKLRMHTEVRADNSPRSPSINFYLLGLEPTPTIPEPSSLVILLVGAILGLHRLRRRSAIRQKPLTSRWRGE